ERRLVGDHRLMVCVVSMPSRDRRLPVADPGVGRPGCRRPGRAAATRRRRRGRLADLLIPARRLASLPHLWPNRTPFCWESVMSRSFKVGDHVGWNSEAGEVSGTITEIKTGDFDYKGHTR